jgi:MFS family permease
MPPDGSAPRSSRYARYVLAVLVLVYVFNFLDRQIISILAERIRADLGVTDAELGFLYGTAFAVFYALFGIPLGRLADVWDRRKLIALGLAMWSAMTALSGLARTFPALALARIGVGIGEASAAPAAFSLLSDWFPRERRATVLAVYSSGIYLGAGLGLVVGGIVVDRWDAAFPTAAPFGLRGWQVAFFLVGLPGLLLALWVRTLREPARESEHGLAPGAPGTAPAATRPLRAFLTELRAVLPPLTIVHLALSGAGWRGIARNLAAAAAIAAIAAALIATLGSAAQWIALGIGLYAGVSWLQALALRDRPTHALIAGTRSLRLAALGFSLLAFVGYGVGFWLPTFFIRLHGVEASRAGLVLGVTSAAAGWLGTTLGGVWADRRRLQTPAGRLQVGAMGPLFSVPLAVWMLLTANTSLGFILAFPVTMASSLWIGPGASTVQDLVLPRMRGSASAAYLLVVTFVGLALGPYTVGRLSVALGDLRIALLCALGAGLVGAAILLLASRHIARDEATRFERAQAAGER